MRISIILLFVFSFINSQTIAQTFWSDSLLLEELNLIEQQPQLDTAIAQTIRVYDQAKSNDFSKSHQKSLWQLSQLYFQNKNTIQALRFGLEFIALLSPPLPYQLNIANEHIGDIYYSEGIYSASLSYYLKCKYGEETVQHLNITEKTADAFLLNNQLDSASLFFQKAMLIHQQNDHYAGELKSLQHLAKINDLSGQGALALQFYQKIEKLVLEHDDKKQLSTVYNNLGYQYHSLGDYGNSIKYFELAFEKRQSNQNLNPTTLFTNLGVAYFNNKEYSKAIQNFERGLAAAYASKNTAEISSLENLIAKVFYERGELYEALLHNDIAVNKSEKAQLFQTLTGAYLTEANIYERLYEYDKALNYYQKHLHLRDSLLLAERIRQEKILQHKFALERSEKEIKLLLVNKKIQDLALEQLTLEKNNLELATSQKENEIILLRREQEIKDERLRIDELQALKAKQELSLTRQRLLASQKDGQIMALEQKEAQQDLELAQRKAEEQAQQQQIMLLNSQKNMQQLELDKQASFRKFTSWLLIALSVILLLILAGYIFARKTNRQLESQKEAIEAQKAEIETEKVKSEQLLLNILPKEVADDLITNGFAKPQQYEKVSVLFADFENFTSLAEKMTPNELIEELNACFIAFDNICIDHNLEKIKTIGDAYMSAGGIPISNESHPQNAVNAALDMMAFINQRHEEKKNNNLPYWKMRIGIHTGPVVAGVVGNNKFAYDIWGDTVNIASRMESNSVPGRINISKQTFEALPAAYQCESRGLLSMKNKEDAEMYFVLEDNAS